MQSVLLVLLLCSALDLVACLFLVSIVWLEHRRVRREAARSGEAIPSARGQFGCLLAFVAVGLISIYGAVWLLTKLG